MEERRGSGRERKDVRDEVRKSKDMERGGWRGIEGKGEEGRRELKRKGGREG